jgi:hypothetical protein
MSLNHIEHQVEYLKENGEENKMKETWTINGLLHREDDLPAEIEYCIFHFENINEPHYLQNNRWFKNGKLYRENDLPTVETYLHDLEYNIIRKTAERWIIDYIPDESKTYIDELIEKRKKDIEFEEREKSDWELRLEKLRTWNKKPLYHRFNELNPINTGPASIQYFNNGNISSEEWYKNGLLHRDGDLPAFISYYKNGNKRREDWYINGKGIRYGDKAGRIEYNQDGTKAGEIYHINNDTHRFGYDENFYPKPSYIVYGLNEKIDFVVYYIHRMEFDEDIYLQVLYRCRKFLLRCLKKMKNDYNLFQIVNKDISNIIYNYY